MEYQIGLSQKIQNTIILNFNFMGKSLANLIYDIYCFVL